MEDFGRKKSNIHKSRSTFSTPQAPSPTTDPFEYVKPKPRFQNQNSMKPISNPRNKISSSLNDFSPNSAVTSRFSEASQKFGGFEPPFQSSYKQQTTSGAITVTEAPILKTTLKL